MCSFLETESIAYRGVSDPPQLKSCLYALYRARKYSENSKKIWKLAIEKYCFMNREYIELDEKSWCKAAIVTRSTKVRSPCGIAALELIPKWAPSGSFWRNPLGCFAVYWHWGREKNTSQNVDVLGYVSRSVCCENYVAVMLEK